MLIPIGKCKLGVIEYYFWECEFCGTNYPEFNGIPYCNGMPIKECLCGNNPNIVKLPGLWRRSV